MTKQTADKPTMPEIFTDVYGRGAPEAARFGVGTSTREGVERATEARRQQKPGDAER